MVVKQGDLFWYQFGNPSGSEPGFRRPCVVIQNNIVNQSRINTAVICAITSNLHLASSPGNVRLYKGEANLPKSSVVNVTQMFTVDKRQLTTKIGTLPKKRIQEIVEGIHLLIDPRELD